MTGLTEFLRYNQEYIDGNDVQFRIDERKLSFFVGCVAIGLPSILLLFVHFTNGRAIEVCFYHSISHFYYSQYLGTFLVGSLSFIGTFLIVYRGESKNQARLASVAGWGAFGVAFFPTIRNGCALDNYLGRGFLQLVRPDGASYVRPGEFIPPKGTEPSSLFWLFEGVEKIHYFSAGVVFLIMAIFALFVFTQVKSSQLDDNGHLDPNKKIRNRFYIFCGLLIAVSAAAMLSNFFFKFAWWDKIRMTFWCEAIALIAFGLAWMVKGRFFNLALLDQQEQSDLRAMAR